MPARWRRTKHSRRHAAAGHVPAAVATRPPGRMRCRKPIVATTVQPSATIAASSAHRSPCRRTAREVHRAHHHDARPVRHLLRGGEDACAGSGMRVSHLRQHRAEQRRQHHALAVAEHRERQHQHRHGRLRDRGDQHRGAGEADALHDAALDQPAAAQPRSGDEGERQRHHCQCRVERREAKAVLDDTASARNRTTGCRRRSRTSRTCRRRRRDPRTARGRSAACRHVAPRCAAGGRSRPAPRCRLPS